MKFGRKRNDHKRWAALRHYANQPHPLWPLHLCPNFTSSVLNVKALVGSRRFQPGEGHSRGLLRDCTIGCGTDGSFYSPEP